MIRSVMLSVFMLICAVNTSRADYLLGFSVDGGSTFVQDVQAPTNTTLNIAVYASQTGTSTALTDSGLLNYGIAGSFTAGNGNVLSNVVSPSFGLFASQVFDNGLGTFTMAGASPTFTGVSGSTILLGTLQYQVLNSSPTAFTLADLSVGSDFTAGDIAFTDLDTEFFSPALTKTYSLSINAVPEPASTALLILASGTIVFRTRVSKRLRTWARGKA